MLAMSMNTVKPTVVIGVGEAGRNILNDTRKIVQSQLSEDAAEAFKYISIDTDASVTEINTDEVFPIQIDEPSGEDWYDDAEAFHYLSPEMEGLASGETGADRQRAVARYQLEKEDNKRQIRDQLIQQIDEHIAHLGNLNNVPIRGTENINVWVINSFGGGTGSGAFLTISLILDSIQRRESYDFYLGGIGGTPALSISSDPTNVMSDIHYAEEHANTYTALRELAALVNYDEKPRREQYGEDGIALKEGSTGETDYVPQESPFNIYYLLGHEPDIDQEQKIGQINRTAGVIVLFMALKEDLENFPDVGRIDDSNTLYTVDASEVHVPVVSDGDWSGDRNLKTIVDSKREISDLDERLDKIQLMQEERRAAKRHLAALVDTGAGVTAPSEYEETPVNPELVRQVKNEAESISYEDINDGIFDFNESVDSVVQEVENLVSETEADPHTKRQVVEYIFGQYLQAHIEETVLQNHPFREQVIDWLEYLADIDDSGVDYEDGPPLFKFDSVVGAWNRKLSTYLENLVDKYEQQAEEQGPLSYVPGVTDYQEKYEEYREILRDLKQNKAAYEEVQEVKTKASTKSASLREQFVDQKGRLEDEIRENKEVRQQVSRKKNDTQSEIDRLSVQLSKTTTSLRRVRVGFDKSFIERVEDREVGINSFDTATDLFKNDELEIDAVVSALENQVDRLSGGPTLQNESEHATKGILSFATAGANVTEGSDDYNVLRQTVSGSKQLDDKMSTEFTHFSEQKTTVHTDHGFVFWVLAQFTNLDLTGMYEYSHFHDHFVDRERDVSETKAGESADMTDADLARRFAYPEFLDDEERITSLLSGEDAGTPQ